MFDPWLFFLAVLHAVSLIAGVVWVCRKQNIPWRDWPFAVYIMVWAGLVLAGHFASIFKSLDKLDVYAAASFLGLSVMLALFLSIERIPAAKPLLTAPGLSFTPISHAKARRFLTIFLIVTMAFAALSCITLGLSIYPDNADSMIYRLPRAFWYVSNGSFLHPFKSLDNRIVFYPLDGVALYVPLVLYNLPGTAHAVPSLISWMLLIYAAYRFARSLGAERLVSFAAAWLVGITPGVFAQSMSTNDEILAATALLAGLYMGWRWLVTGRRGYFLLAATSVSISVGTKLHFLFLSPVIIAMIAIAAWHIWRRPERLKEWIGAVGGETLLASLIMAIVMVMPFLLYNYLSTGRIYFFGEFEDDVFNLGASLRGALQNLLIYVLQMTVSPIADLNSWPVANDRQHFNNMLNSLFNPLIKPLISEDPKFYHLGYRFVGITIPVSVRFVEFSLWSGFVWMLWPLQVRLVLSQPFALRGPFFLIAMTPPIWLLLWSFSTLYMEGTATYFTYYLICAAPAAVFSFAVMRSALWNELRWVLIIFVGLTNFIISTNMLMYSGFRALPDLYYAKSLPYDWCHFEQRIIDEIRAADRIRIIALHEKLPFFAFMRWNPRARFYTPYPVDVLPEAEKILQVLPVSSLDRYGFMPLKIPGKLTPGVTYLGSIRAIGREAIFALGNGVERRYPGESDYLIPQISINQLADGSFVSLDEKQIAGFSAQDHLEFMYEIFFNGEKIFTREWDKSPDFSVKIAGYDPFVKPALITIAVRSSWGHKELARQTYRLGGPGEWLPEGAEYDY